MAPKLNIKGKRSRNIKSRKWIFTLNNYTPAEVKKMDQYMENCCVYGTYGFEIGEEEGTPHLQCFVYYKNEKTWGELLKYFDGRLGKIQAAKTVDAAIDYCHKGQQSHEEWAAQKVDGPNFGKDAVIFEVGKRPRGSKTTLAHRMERNQLLLTKSLVDLVRDGDIAVNQVPVLKKARLILAQEGEALTTEDVRGVWIHGEPGTGKSHSARHDYGTNIYVKAQNKWFDGYAGHDVIVMDDFDAAVLGHYMKIWADKWGCQGEVKGGTVNLQHTKFVVTSNYTPAHFWPNDKWMREAITRRFKMIEKNEVYVHPE